MSIPFNPFSEKILSRVGTYYTGINQAIPTSLVFIAGALARLRGLVAKAERRMLLQAFVVERPYAATARSNDQHSMLSISHWLSAGWLAVAAGLAGPGGWVQCLDSLAVGRSRMPVSACLPVIPMEMYRSMGRWVGFEAGLAGLAGVLCPFFKSGEHRLTSAGQLRS